VLIEPYQAQLRAHCYGPPDGDGAEEIAVPSVPCRLTAECEAVHQVAIGWD
jgi:hypothetical protein